MNSLFEDSGGKPDDPAPADRDYAGSVVTGLGLSSDEPPEAPREEQYVLAPSEPESMAQTVRRSGLAWSAGIAMFGSVIFMMVIGWLADLFLGTSPWGIVGGIVLGSLIGFVQFFRITSQIFKN